MHAPAQIRGAHVNVTRAPISGALNLQESKPGEGDEDVNGEKKSAHHESQDPKVLALDVAAPVIDGRRPSAIRREDAHKAETVGEEKRPSLGRCTRDGYRNHKNDLEEAAHISG